MIPLHQQKILLPDKIELMIPIEEKIWKPAFASRGCNRIQLPDVNPANKNSSDRSPGALQNHDQISRPRLTIRQNQRITAHGKIKHYKNTKMIKRIKGEGAIDSGYGFLREYEVKKENRKVGNSIATYPFTPFEERLEKNPILPSLIQ